MSLLSIVKLFIADLYLFFKREPELMLHYYGLAD